MSAMQYLKAAGEQPLERADQTEDAVVSQSFSKAGGNIRSHKKYLDKAIEQGKFQ